MRLPILSVMLVCCCGCATIFNGSEQDVPVKIPNGTVISNFNGTQIPIHKAVYDNDTIMFIRLKRKTEQLLRFVYRGNEALITIPRSVDGGIIGADIFFYVYPLFIDAITGAWHSFDGIAVTFPDSTSRGSTRATVELYEPDKLFTTKLGIVTLAAMGFMGPTHNQIIPLGFINEFLFGIGYEPSERLSILAEWNFANDVNFLRGNSKYRYDHSDFSSYQIQIRYDIIDDLYGALGGGVGSASVDHIWYRDEDDIRHIFSGTTQTFPTAFAAFGYSGRRGYVELRRTLGFGSFTFPNGEPFDFAATSLNFGFNFHF